MSTLNKLFMALSVCARMLLLSLLGRPYKLTLLVSGGCNLRCQVCSIWRAPNTTLTLADVRRLWDAFPIKPCWINLSGGEPTLNSELEAILSFFVELDRPLFITLTSNGYADCSPLVERVMRRNRRSLLYVSISIDGEEPEHNAVRGRARSFARAVRTQRRLRALKSEFAGLEVGISTTVSRVNHRRILPFIREMLRQKQPISVNLAQSSDYYATPSSDSFQSLPARELVQLLEAIEVLLPKLSLHSLLKVSFLEDTIAYLEGRYAPVPCASISSNLLVTSELELVNCTIQFQPWGPKSASREARLDAIVDVIENPRPRRDALFAKIRASGCEQGCHTPCESYVHNIAALLHPRWAPGILWTYLRVCLTSAFTGERRVQLALADSHAYDDRDAGSAPEPPFSRPIPSTALLQKRNRNLVLP